ncbi:hypothetical protein [Gordonia phthalatica]|uniref:Uncharacterized protein n=1 Tax=Gordonia phthalatica TaxID=1136941 RepID=A0A0N9NA19_9ACTN|nr:hypothetical protein [Gordonia phthalatica]ALG84307.1 hypothetical protein ACH46_07080 [Gordonia phthalatica]
MEETAGETTSDEGRQAAQSDDKDMLDHLGLAWIKKLGSFADVLIGVGVALLAMAVWVATMVLINGTPNESQHFYGTGGETRFTDIRLPVAGGVVLMAGLVIVLVATLFAVRRSAPDGRERSGEPSSPRSAASA